MNAHHDYRGLPPVQHMQSEAGWSGASAGYGDISRADAVDMSANLRLAAFCRETTRQLHTLMQGNHDKSAEYAAADLLSALTQATEEYSAIAMRLAGGQQ